MLAPAGPGFAGASSAYSAEPADAIPRIDLSAFGDGTLTQFRWRPLTAADLAQVADIARIAFPEHHEDPACFAERLALSPSWCFALDDGTGSLKGYLIAYPWPRGTIPPLNAPLGALPEQGEALFLHDLATRPDAAGWGQARAIVDELARRAEVAGFREIALVAVNDSLEFWRRQGFTVADGSPALKAKLATYGNDARYMRRHLDGQRNDCRPKPRT